jgi:biopolymer transport protein ExbB
MRRTRAVVSFALAFIGCTWATQALAWWNNDWEFRKEITLDLSPAGADIPGAPADVPVLIRLSLANFQYFNDAKADGSDLRFIAGDDKTPLKHHVERFDAQAQIAFVWVRVPRLTGGANTDKIFLYYGSKKATNGADAAGTYDANQVLVYHFGPAAGSAQDSSSFKSEPSQFTAEVVPASLIGSGLRFSGSQNVQIPATGALHLAAEKGYTLSAWVRFESAGTAPASLAQLAGEGGRELMLGLNGAQAFARYADGGTAVPVTAQGTTALTPAEWHHLALRIGEGALTLFVDGADAAHVNVTAKDIAGTLTVGGSAGNFFTGDLDELEISSAARSTDWIKAAARSQGMVAPLVVYGGDAQKEGGGESYFATTLRSVTIDGWVIIGCLAVMFFLATVIMITKGVYLARVASANARFLVEFRKMSGDPTALERATGGSTPEREAEEAAFEEGTKSQLADAFSRDEESSGFGLSTLWRLYHHGIRETMKRVEGQAAGADRTRELSAQSIEAIRASLDAALTRMTQQLNKQMVWLTVAISGGPFLGLLGTVVGVMITFAAIAASGDVNINAIAPGTAAALVATVAGLGVAIPCLFGYNYLNTRSKEIGADMRVFVDEFVARIAETYS